MPTAGQQPSDKIWLKRNEKTAKRERSWQNKPQKLNVLKTSHVLLPVKLKTTPVHNSNQIDRTSQMIQLMNASVGKRMKVAGRIVREGMTGEKTVREVGSQIEWITIEERSEV